MQQEQMILYIRENIMTIALTAGGIVLLIWLFILVQVTRTRREVHKVCKKIYRYFEVILADEAAEEAEASPVNEAVSADAQIPQQQAPKETPQQRAHKTEEDVKLLMDVISEVF